MPSLSAAGRGLINASGSLIRSAEWYRQRTLFIGAGLFLVGVATRLPFLTGHLYSRDTIRLALGMHDFNVVKHQPQPPGYILYVGLLRCADAVLHNGTLTLTLMSALFAALSVALIFHLAMMLFDDGLAAGLVSSAWLTNPILWYYSEIGEIFPAGACASLATALSTLKFWENPSSRTAILAGSVFAAGIGLRQDQGLFLVPMVLLPILCSRSCRQYTALLAAVFVLTCLAWFLPLVELSGGYKAYSALLHRQFVSVVQTTSVFYGASVSAHLRMLVAFGTWLLLGILPFAIMAPLLLTWRGGEVKGRLLDKRHWHFLIAWFAPFCGGRVHGRRVGERFSKVPSRPGRRLSFVEGANLSDM